MASIELDKRALRPRYHPNMRRFGRATGDGGYVIPSDIVDRSTVLLSLGLGTDWTFDTDVRDRRPGIRIIGVDHSIRARRFAADRRRSVVKRRIYTILGNTAKADKHTSYIERSDLYTSLFRHPSEHVERMVGTECSTTVVDIHELFRKVGPTAPHSVLLKMDIEGSEYDVVNAIATYAPLLNCITAEFHDLRERTSCFNAAIRTLSEHFHVVHVHGNNCGPYCTVIDFPETVEVTFVNRALMPDVPDYAPYTYPRADVDVPNRPDRPDYAILFD